MERAELLTIMVFASIPAVLKLLKLDPLRVLPLVLVALIVLIRDRKLKIPDYVFFISLLIPLSSSFRPNAKWMPFHELIPNLLAYIPVLIAPFSLGYFIAGWRSEKKLLTSFTVGFFLQSSFYFICLALGIHKHFDILFTILLSSALLSALLMGWRPSVLVLSYDASSKLSLSAYVLTVSIQAFCIPALHGDMWTYHARAFTALNSFDSFQFSKLLLPYPPLHTLAIASAYLMGSLPIFNSSILFLSLGPAILVQSVKAFYSKFIAEKDRSTVLFILGGGLGGLLYWFSSVGSPTYAEDLLNTGSHVSEFTGDMLRSAAQSRFLTPVASSLGLALFLNFISLSSSLVAGISLASSFLTHFIETFFLIPIWILAMTLKLVERDLKRLVVAISIISSWILLDGGYMSYYISLKFIEALNKIDLPLSYVFLALASFAVFTYIISRFPEFFSRAFPFIALSIFYISFFLWLIGARKLPPIETMLGRGIEFISSQFYLLLLVPSLFMIKRRRPYARARTYFWAIAFTYFALGMVFWGERTMEFAQLGLAPLMVYSIDIERKREKIFWFLMLLLVSQSIFGLYTARMAESAIPIYNSSPSELKALEWLEERNATILVTDGYTAQHNALLYRGLMDLRVAPLFGASAPPNYPAYPNPQEYRFMSLALVNGMTIGDNEFTLFALKKLNVTHIYINRKNLKLHQEFPAFFNRWRKGAFLLSNLSSIADIVWKQGEVEIWELKELPEVRIEGDAIAEYLLVNGSVKGYVSNLVVHDEKSELLLNGTVEVRGVFLLTPCGRQVCVTTEELIYNGSRIKVRGSSFSPLLWEIEAESLVMKYGGSGRIWRFEAEDPEAEALVVTLYNPKLSKAKVWKCNSSKVGFEVDFLRLEVISENLHYLDTWSNPELGDWEELWIQVKTLKGGKIVREATLKVNKGKTSAGAMIPMTNVTLVFQEILSGDETTLHKVKVEQRKGESYLFGSLYSLQGVSGEAEITFSPPLVIKLTKITQPLQGS